MSLPAQVRLLVLALIRPHPHSHLTPGPEERSDACARDERRPRRLAHRRRHAAAADLCQLHRQRYVVGEILCCDRGVLILSRIKPILRSCIIAQFPCSFSYNSSFLRSTHAPAQRYSPQIHEAWRHGFGADGVRRGWDGMTEIRLNFSLRKQVATGGQRGLPFLLSLSGYASSQLAACDASASSGQWIMG